MWCLWLYGAVMRSWLGKTCEQEPSCPEHQAKDLLLLIDESTLPAEADQKNDIA
jgi:hypothetical protein